MSIMIIGSNSGQIDLEHVWQHIRVYRFTYAGRPGRSFRHCGMKLGDRAQWCLSANVHLASEKRYFSNRMHGYATLLMFSCLNCEGDNLICGVISRIRTTAEIKVYADWRAPRTTHLLV